MRAHWRFGLGVALLLVLLSGAAYAFKPTERSREKAAAEARRSALQSRMSELQRSMNQTARATDKAAEALGQSAQAISKANRTLHELDNEQADTARRLAELSQQRAGLAAQVSAQQAGLAKLLRDQYIFGNEDQSRLLLSGDDPSRINRDLQYLAYVSQSEAKLIAALRGNLQAIDANAAKAQEADAALHEIADEARNQRTVLQNEKSRRAAMLATLSTKLAGQRKQVGELQRDDQRLGALVGKLEQLIEQQRAAEVASAQRRQKKLADAKTAQERRRALQAQKSAQRGTGKMPPAQTDAIDDDESPKKFSNRNEPNQQASVETSVAGHGFGALRGQLRLPVRGEITARFGSERGGGPSSKGLFIRAAEGAEIHTVASGKVVFADWLRGFGNLIIVDHGDQYLTVYGNNQSVLKHPGDAVKSGETIATAGNSGGNEQSGLYFEIRHQGRAFDPMSWVTLR